MRAAFVTLRKGARLFHGTAAPETFSALRGPAWLSTCSARAAQIYRIATRGRVKVFKTRRPLRLLVGTHENLARAAGRKLHFWTAENLVDHPREGARGACAMGITGLFLRNRGGQGCHDIVVCNPSVLRLGALR